MTRSSLRPTSPVVTCGPIRPWDGPVRFGIVIGTDDHARRSFTANREVDMVMPKPDEQGTEPIDSVEIVIHEVPYLCPEDVTTVEGIPVTAPARTLLDCATCLEDDELREALHNALTRGLTTRAEIFACMGRYPDHEGRVRLSRLLDDGQS